MLVPLKVFLRETSDLDILLQTVAQRTAPKRRARTSSAGRAGAPLTPLGQHRSNTVDEVQDGAIIPVDTPGALGLLA